jgi:hypothetical protein
MGEMRNFPFSLSLFILDHDHLNFFTFGSGLQKFKWVGEK